jgi:two-component system chemotaxis sensor kinase CheA
MTADEEFYAEIREFFLVETHDLLENVESSFLDLEKNPEDKEIIQSIFRFVHNIKGSAKSVGLNSLSEFTHHLENILVSIRNDELTLNSELVSLLLESNDRIRENVEALQEDINNELDNSDLIAKIESFLQNPQTKVESKITGDIKVEDSIESAIEEVAQEIFEQDAAEEKPVGELLVEQNLVKQEDVEKAVKYQESKVGEILVDQGKVTQQKLDATLKQQKKKKQEEYIRIALSKIDEMVNYFGEQVILQSTLEYAKDDILANRDLIVKTVSQLSKITYDLQQTAISLRMVSIKTLFAKLERIVRDASKSLGKEIVFHKSGNDYELDKNILESIVDPLTHMIRNSVDHGIETKEERVKKGKDPVGNVWLSAYPRGGFFYLEIKDDGQGLNKEKILVKAMEKGIVGDGSKLTDAEIYNLIFRSGFSTKEKTTELSGRGVGMDVVKTTIERLKGSCFIDSTPGEGSCFTIRLPQTLAIFNGMIVQINGYRYVVANSDLVEVVPFDISKMRKVESGAVIDVKGEVVEVVELNKILKINTKQNDDLEPSMLIVVYKNKKYGLTVDRLIAQQRVVHKPVGVEMKQVKGITGGTILGDGSVALILSPSELLASLK